MRTTSYIYLILALIISACKTDSDKSTTEKILNDSLSATPIFKLVDSRKSHLNFSNIITENINNKNNLFDYDYFYNGAGVGLEDLNNDGLLDVFFCGNQVDNKLYINKGSLTFEDISEHAKINTGKVWSNGITFVDINSDGWMDIYVSQGGPYDREHRKNLLFINQKNGSFTERAEQYGLADMGISTQSVFFDFDNDGDLDCLVMNENELYGVNPVNLKKLISRDDETKYFNSSHLYRNEEGLFVDVTNQSGLNNPIFGLGLSVSDFNNDGWLDFYIASDYYIPDVMYLNNQNGTFTDEIKQYTNHISFYGMGMDIADINNDNLQDIFVLDMAANDHVRAKTLMKSMNVKNFDYLVNKAQYHHQYMYNSLQLNTGLGKYSNIAQATKMANTDWSWSVLMSDYDLDGDKDVYITNGYRKYGLDNDLQKKVFEVRMKYRNQVPLAVKEKLYNQIPSEKLPNVLFENFGDLNFKENGKNWGLADFSFSNGAAQGDLDNDGDIDLIVNNIDDNCYLYQNNSIENGRGNFLKVTSKSLSKEYFPKITISHNNTKQLIEPRRVRGYRSSHENIAHFGLGESKIIDTLSILWPDGKMEQRFCVKANTTVKVDYTDATNAKPQQTIAETSIFKAIEAATLGLKTSHRSNFYNDFEKEILLPYKQSTVGPSITKGDLNGDSLDDFFIGGGTGQSGQLYFQKANGTFYRQKSKALINDKRHEDTDAAIFDWDNDGDMDIYVVSGGNAFANYSSYYADRLYINDGSGNLTKIESRILQNNPKSGKTVTTLDFDKDGDLDIIVGNRTVAQSYPIPAASTLYENRNGELFDVTETAVPELIDFGIVNDIIPTDFNGDEWMDFIAVGDWTGIGMFENNEGQFKNINSNGSITDIKGWWFSISETDLNNDGLADYLLGNVGANIKFKTSKQKPFKVFANDFDENGTPDIVLSNNYNGTYVPVRGRECSTQQMPFIGKKYKSYTEFANASLTDIYGEKLISAYESQANDFKSGILLNKGNGSYTFKHLPDEAQLFPILGTVYLDLNNDGFDDVIVAGNVYETEAETPRLDANSGLILISNGKDSYNPMKWKEAGLLFDGNIKDVELIKTTQQNVLLGIQNNGPVSVFGLNQ